MNVLCTLILYNIDTINSLVVSNPILFFFSSIKQIYSLLRCFRADLYESNLWPNRMIVGNGDGGPSKTEEVEDDEEEDEEETETSSESSETDSDEDSEDAKPKTPASRGMEKTDIGPLLARSAQARDNNGSGSNSSSRRTSRDEAGGYAGTTTRSPR